MIKKVGKLNRVITISLIVILLGTAVVPITLAVNIDRIEGFDKGSSYQSVVPIEKVTFVNFDENTILDDYAYLAAVPTAVFRSGDKLISYPLLFYQDEYPVEEDKERSLNARQGIDYFMEDWMSYCNGQLDQMTLINVPKNKLDSSWKARDYTMIESDDPYDSASKLALQDWSYSDDAVIAVIEEDFEKSETEYNGMIEGVIPSGYGVDEQSFEMEEPNIGVGGNYHAFDITEPYKYVVANMHWKNAAIDLDLQIYDDQLGMADASSDWNIFYGAGERVSSYVYNYGKWEIGVTYMPTQSLPDEGKMKSMFQNVDEEGGFLSKLGLGNRRHTQTVDVNLYPGVELDLEDPVPFGCRNVEFKLKWDKPNVALGFVILDPTGAETASAPSDEEIIEGVDRSENERVINIEKLGETGEGEKYKICVFTLDDMHSQIDFTVEYSWQQNFSREEGESLASATEGAVLASVLNAPLLYTSTDAVSDATIDALYKLGVENIYLVNFGERLSSDVAQKLKDVASVKEEFTEYKAVYDMIRELTGRNDVIFSTIDPWTYYYGDIEIPQGEFPGALFIGPAAYIAAHHGAPVLLVDNHPELSQAIVWHTKFWRDTARIRNRPKLPSVACMVLTGRSVMKFLEAYGYDLPKDKENLETMITVADHFDIGMTWDRTFTGALIPGRFCSSPVDVSYWIPRSVFYPVLIFENPALQGEVALTTGSESTVKPYIGKFMHPKGTDLVITKPSREEEFEYPILHTYNCHLYHFNRDASKHWGGQYTTANGITPYETPSPHSIDVGVTDKVGAYYPDMTESEVAPIYAEKAGFSNCFSTNFEITMENLNQGVIMWMESCHGGNAPYGGLGFWNPESPYVDEPNPWRAYEKITLSPGNLDEFVQWLPEFLEESGIHVPSLLFKLPRIFTKPLDLLLIDKGCTENPDVAVMNAQIPIPYIMNAFGVDLHIKESHGLSLLPIIGRKFRAYGDGIVIDGLPPGGKNVIMDINGVIVDDVMDNLHSCGINAVSCLIANTYMHQVFIRHGAPYQILDPWVTSWYSTTWLTDIPRQLALGYTMGEAYERGMAMIGVEYLVDQWWWDLNENVVFYGDPDIRVYTPSTEWDSEGSNYWEQSDVESLRYNAELNVDGHMPFGATGYPHAKEPLTFFEQYLLIIIAIIVISVTVVAAAYSSRRKK